MRGPTSAALGDFVKRQRLLAKLSQRELARLAGFSDAYLSQIERGLHRPSVRIIGDLASALNLPADTLLNHMGLKDDEDSGMVGTTELAIGGDPLLTEEQKRSLLDVYAAFVAANSATAAATEANSPKNA